MNALTLDGIRLVLLLSVAVVCLSFIVVWTVGYRGSHIKTMPESKLGRYLIIIDVNGFPFVAGVSSLLVAGAVMTHQTSPWLGVAVNGCLLTLGLVRWSRWLIVRHEERSSTRDK